MNTNSKRKAAQIAKQHSARRVAKREQKRAAEAVRREQEAAMVGKGVSIFGIMRGL